MTNLKEQIEAYASEGKLIHLVKLHREMFKSSIKEAKKAIDSAQISCTSLDRKYDLEKLYEVFKLKDGHIVQAVKVLIDNWELLGYTSPLEAIKQYCERNLKIT